MAELRLERQPGMNHCEITGGSDVTSLLSHISHNIKQSKADQILRLLQDQDKTPDHIETLDESESDLLDEYDLIREEKVICDSDTLTDSSSVSEDSDITVNNQVSDPVVGYSREYSHGLVQPHLHQNISHIANSTDMNGRSGRESTGGHRRHRARTSVGFHNDMETDEAADLTRVTNFDTRDLSIRPKSSYVRRNQYRKKDDVELNADKNTVDYTDSVPHRPSRSARPKSRLGRGSVHRTERKIVMVEAEVTSNEPLAPAEKEEVVRNVGNNAMYDRFSSVRQPKRESKRAKAFCDPTAANQMQISENTNVESYGSTSDIREDMTEVQHYPTHNSRSSHASGIRTTAVPRNSPVQNKSQNPVPQKRPSNMHVRHEHSIVNNRPEYNQTHSYTQQQQQQHQHQHHHQQQLHQHLVSDPKVVRSDSIVSNNNNTRPERQANVAATHIPLKRNNSNVVAQSRPKNPEPVSSRPIDRPDLRTSTRTRRLHRRYMAPTQSHMASVRPTSESVILARQKTEMNLMKKQAENRPHSEKIMINPQNKNIDINLNPTQGPQTYVTSKGGVTQASHVQAGGFRGYDPSSRQKSSKPSRDIPADLTLPRGGQNNVLMSGGRKSLAALMKLPPLEASLAAKKKERGLALAARETCV